MLVDQNADCARLYPNTWYDHLADRAPQIASMRPAMIPLGLLIVDQTGE